MPNSFSKLYVHHVSAVKYRQALILPEFEDRLYQYVIGIIKELNQTLKNQKEHHKKVSFRAEYLKLLRSNGIDTVNDYLPEFFEGVVLNNCRSSILRHRLQPTVYGAFIFIL